MPNKNVEKFFSALQEKVKAFNENYAYFAPKLAPKFNCFDFILPNEVKLSKILAEILNPKGSHAQGDLFLRLFLDLLFSGTTIEANKIYPKNSSVVVKCEQLTTSISNSYRRIDILINLNGKFGLAIENKPWANDQDKQLSDYAEHLNNSFKDWCLIYLSGSGSAPSDISATKDEIEAWEAKEQYQKKDFNFIFEWLEKCEQQCQADHVKHFLRDFIMYCKNTFLGGGSMIDEDLITKFALENKYNLEIALAVGKQMWLPPVNDQNVLKMSPIEKAMVTKFLNDLNSKLTNSDCVWEQTHNKYVFGLKNEKCKNCLFAVCFQHPAGSGGYNNTSGKVVIGVLKDDGLDAFNDDLFNHLSRQMENSNGTKNIWWIWYHELDFSLEDYNESDDWLIKMNTKGITNAIWCEMSKLIDLTESHLYMNKSGIGYFLPLKIEKYRVKNWMLSFQTYEEFGADIQHFDWWQNQLAEFLLETLRLEIDANTLADFKLRYTGIPRFRVEQIKGIYNIYHGGNLTADMKNQIANYFGIDKIKYVFDDHETYSHDDKDVVQFVLNLSENTY